MKLLKVCQHIPISLLAKIYINAKLDAKGITGDKRECMQTIIGICIRVLFNKIRNLNLTSVIRDNSAKFLSAIGDAGMAKTRQIAEKGKDMFQGAFNRGLDLMGSIGSRK